MSKKQRGGRARSEVTRRDFLNGVAVTLGGALTLRAQREALAFEPGDSPGSAEYYPPVKTGLRGSHEGSFEAFHHVRDGQFWATAGAPEPDPDTYDLIVVGGGLSGLASACLFRAEAGPDSRVLILDNHDDFGGHAKRNEFHQGGPLRLAHGGTFAIESPSPYSAFAQGFIKDLGIDVSSWARVGDRKLYSSLGLARGVFFHKEAFGRDALTPNPLRDPDVKAGKGPSDTWRTFAKEAPLSPTALADLETLLFKAADPFPGLSPADKRARLARISYAKYLTEMLKLSPDVVRVLQALPHSLYGIGIDGVPAQDAVGLGLPGFAALQLDPGPGIGQNRDSIRNEAADKYFFHFPDGNSSIARLMVRRLIPGAVPGSTAADIVTAHTQYARLDQPGNATRIRLNSTAVRVKHVGDPASATEVEVTYLREGKLRSARARSCVLACWHTTIPYLCPELGTEQREALAYAVKVPIVYTSVLLRNWTAFTKAGFSGFYAPAGYHSSLDLTIPLHIGDFASPKDPKEPVTVHMTRTPCSPGLPARDQHRAGRADLLATPFERFESEIRDQFTRAYGPSGFDSDRDLLAITVNRWPHGYAYQYNSLFDPFWLEGGTTPCEIARRPFGRVAIANADSMAYSYTDAALDSAARAVKEVMSVRSRTAGNSGGGRS